MSTQIEGIFISLSPGESAKIEKLLLSRGLPFDAVGIKKFILQNCGSKSSIDSVIADTQRKILDNPEIVFDIMENVTDNVLGVLGGLFKEKKPSK